MDSRDQQGDVESKTGLTRQASRLLQYNLITFLLTAPHSLTLILA